MLKDQNIICISSIDWDFIWQGHQEIMLSLAKNGNRVLFIENTGARVPGVKDFSRIESRIKNWFTGINGIREVEKNLYVFSPLVLPFPYLRIATILNSKLIMFVLSRWFKVMDFTNPVIWAFLPTPLTLNIIDKVTNKLVIYYCIDNFRVSSSAAKKIEKSEISLLKKSDLVFATSRDLYDYCAKYNNNVYIFPFAVNFRDFEDARLKDGIVLSDLKNMRTPVIGYIGGVHKWIDFDLIKHVALECPQYSFVFVGPVQTDISILAGINNIYFLGKKDHKEIPFFVKNFDVCIIPYLITDYTRNVYPTKLNEYLVMGKPVISTDLPEIVNFNKENNDIISIAKTKEEFVSCMRSFINYSDKNLAIKRIDAARKNSWENRITDMSILIEKVLNDKFIAGFDWKVRFLKLFRLTRQRVLKLVFLFFSIYFVLFYTPLIWLMAEPLKITQTPQRADVIVVFAGGVGESGKAGEGYEERVQCAVDLYKNGYASNIIFSSGYSYIFKETLMMKALAVTLGVPEGIIILEDRAANNYENVWYSSNLLRKNKWSRILLVSSSYNMRRSSLVFNKIARDIKVVYVSAASSIFYSHNSRFLRGKTINFSQMRGILHEYLGIIYYWYKGWI